jgi:hypothetical protein
LHYWVGSYCRARRDDRGDPFFPLGVTAACDIITLVEDMGNQIPDKSWMLYLLELFNAQNMAMELNLICQFDNQDYFEAIFQGVNRYRFREVLPQVGHSYMRMIIMDKKNERIRYTLTEKGTNVSETYDFFPTNFEFLGTNQFTGLEWWNKKGNFPYPVRYQAEIFQIMFGLSESSNEPESITFVPYSTLIPNKDESNMRYPISFQNIMLRDGCVCYSVQSGNCTNGIRYNI